MGYETNGKQYTTSCESNDRQQLKPTERDTHNDVLGC